MLFNVIMVLLTKKKFSDVANFTTQTPLSLLILYELSFSFVGLKISSLFAFTLTSQQNFHIVPRKLIKYTFYFLTISITLILEHAHSEYCTSDFLMLHMTFCH
jgi:hypothetical protein